MSAIAARSASPTSPSQESSAKADHEEKHVSFHPLAVYITTAPEGEPEQTMVDHAREELSHRKRRVGVRTYRCEPPFVPSSPFPGTDKVNLCSWDAPQIGDATSKAWHSMLNGFTATLEPFLHSGAGSSSSGGGVCSSSSAYRRESSPDRLSMSRSRSRSQSEGRSEGTSARRGADGRDDPTSPDYDPTFIPAPRPRLSLKLPTIMRTPSRAVYDSASSPTTGGGGCVFLTCPRKSILRRSPTRSESPIAPSPHPFPALARTVSPPPPPYHEPSWPMASDVIPLLPCCAACEKATLYGSEATALGSYEENWSRGARKARHEAEKREAARAEWRRAAEALGDKYRCPIEVRRPSDTRPNNDFDDEDEDDEVAHPDCPSSRLGEMVRRSGNIDELGDVRASVQPAPATEEDEEPVRSPDHQGLSLVGKSSPAVESAPAPESAPPPESALPAESAPPSEPAISREPEPAPAPTRAPSHTGPAPRPAGRRRLSSISSRIAATLGGGLLSSPSHVTGLGA